MQKYNKKRVILVLKGVVPVPLNFHFYVIPHLASPIHLLHPFPRRPISQNTEPDTVSVLSSGNESAFVVLSWTLWVWTGVVESALVVFSLLWADLVMVDASSFSYFSVAIRITSHETSSHLGRLDWHDPFSVRRSCSWEYRAVFYTFSPRAHLCSLCAVALDAACSRSDRTLWNRNATPSPPQFCHRYYKSWRQKKNVSEG